jgi:hypothetical protein
MKFFGTVTVFVCLALAAAMMSARAQSWGRGGAYAGAGGTSQGYYPRTGVHSCTWSVAASCAARRNGSYERDGIRHQLVKRSRDGKLVVRVYQNGTRVK